ncbi:phosphate signaling complex protein PhoU [bacterium]|nr:phosphate signaling complex protein PhoU [bacterium]
MTRSFQHELDKIKRTVLSLGAEVEDRVRRAAEALETCSEKLSKEIIASDKEINRLEINLEVECLMVLARHQPVAIDLRFVVAVIKMNNELESIADQAVNIAERVEVMARTKNKVSRHDYAPMMKIALTMLKNSLDALVNKDIKLAFSVIIQDDEVDDLKKQAYHKIKDLIQIHPQEAEYLINLLLVSRHIEKIGDHATNIAEEVAYMVEGEIVRHGNFKEEPTHNEREIRTCR